MDWWVHFSLPTTQRVSISATYHVQSWDGWNFVCLYRCGPSCCKFSIDTVDSGIQRPVYYMSKSLHEVEIRYLPLEKAILAVVHTTWKLPYYFQAHTVVVLTQLPLKSVLWSAYYTGRIAKWGTVLGVFDIKYMLRTSVKGQILTDLVVVFTEPPLEGVAVTQNMDGKSVGTISL